MYDKLLNKNVITAVLVSLMTLSVNKTCEAQGVVSLAEEEKVVLPQDNTSGIVEENDNIDELGFEIAAEIPDSLPEDEGVIPFDNEPMISPEPAVRDVSMTEEAEALVETPAEAETSNIDLLESDLPDNENRLIPEGTEAEDDTFDLGLETVAAEEETQTASLSDNKVSTANVNALPVNLADTEPTQPSEPFANSILSKVDNDLFSQMSDIEKQTTLLTLELRREKIRSEIDAVKAQRARAEQEKIAAEEEKKRKELEWKQEQEAKILKEKQLLKEKEIELEKLKQRKALVSYMNKMLEDKQSWINENAELLKKLKEVEKARNEMADKFKEKLDNLTTLSNNFIQSANSAKSNHDRTIASLTAQNLQLKKRIEAQTAQNTQNPFGPNVNNASQDGSVVEVAKEYAILDISGKGDNLVAKLINKDGDSFSTRKGTVLQTGHVVEEITPSYIKFNINGFKQFLYLVDTVEPEKLGYDNYKKSKKAPVAPTKPEKSNIGNSSSAPTLGAGMFVK